MVYRAPNGRTYPNKAAYQKEYKEAAARLEVSGSSGAPSRQEGSSSGGGESNNNNNQPTALENYLGQSLPENLRYSSVNEYKAGQSIQTNQSKEIIQSVSNNGRGGDSSYVPPPVETIAPMSSEQGPVLVTSSGQIIGSATPEVAVPEIKINYESISTPLPYQTQGTINLQPTVQFIEPYGHYNLTPTDLAKGLLTAVGTGAKNLGKFTTSSLNKAGVGSVSLISSGSTMAVGKRETVNINQQDQIFKPLTDTTMTFSPETVGKAVETGALVGAYFTPYLGQSLLAAGTLRGIDTFQTTVVPKKADLLNQYKPTDITQQEYQDYLKTSEGKLFNSQVDDYISGIKAQKTGGLIEAGLSAGLLFGAGAVKAYKYETQPIKIIDDFQALPKPQNTFLGIVQQQEKGSIAQIKTLTTMPDILGIQAPRYKVQIGKYITGEVKGKPTIFEKGYTIEGKSYVGSLGETSPTIGHNLPGVKTKTYQTLTKPSTYKGSADEVLLFDDLSKLPKNQKYISNELLKVPEVIPEGTQYFGARGQVSKGISVFKDPITGSEVRVMARRKSTADLLIPTRKEVYSGDIMSFGRMKPAGQLNENLLFDVDIATKKTTPSMNPRASGTVDIARGKIIVRPYKTPEGLGNDITYIIPSGKKSSQSFIQSLSQKDAQILVGKTSNLGVSSFPKTPKISKSPKAIAPQEEFLFYPKYVGGLGRGVSTYTAKGKLDQADIFVPQVYKQNGKPSQPSVFDFSKDKGSVLDSGLIQPLDYQPVVEIVKGSSKNRSKGGSKDIFGITNNSGQGTNLGNLEVSGSGSGLGLGTLEVARQREDQISINIFNQPVIETTRQPQIEVVREVQISIPKTNQTFKQPQINILRPRYQHPWLRTPRFNPPRTPTYPLRFGSNQSPKKRFQPKESKGNIFITEIRRKGKFRALTSASSLQEARSKGSQYALTTLGASFRVKTPSGYASLSGDNIFRTSKRDSTILVQRASKRLSSFGERSEISRTRRRGGGFIL